MVAASGTHEGLLGVHTVHCLLNENGNFSFSQGKGGEGGGGGSRKALNCKSEVLAENGNNEILQVGESLKLQL